MKEFLLTALLLSPTVHAQVIECPKHLPSKELRLSDTPSPHQAGARILPTSLSYANIQFSELYGQPMDVPPEAKKVKGGWDTEYRFMQAEKTKWLVCSYGGASGSVISGGSVTGAAEWWGKVDEKSTTCVLKIRELKDRYLPTFYTATAVCK